MIYGNKNASFFRLTLRVKGATSLRFYEGRKMEYDKTKVFYMAKSELLIEPYQGRTYILDRGIMGLEKNVEPEDFVEYISDGYECFVGDPLLLAEKDPVLYNYFVRRGIR